MKKLYGLIPRLLSLDACTFLCLLGISDRIKNAIKFFCELKAYYFQTKPRKYSMSIDLTTPALLFSTISLLLLAYTNRFLGLASIIRKLYSDHLESPKDVYIQQIDNLSKRVRLIRDMQTLGVFSLLLCTVCMCVLFMGWQQAGKVLFGASLVLMALSLLLSIIEIRMSVGALDLHLRDMKK